MSRLRIKHGDKQGRLAAVNYQLLKGRVEGKSSIPDRQFSKRAALPISIYLLKFIYLFVC